MPNLADSTAAVVLRRARLPFDLLSVPGCLEGQRCGYLLECDLLLAQGRILDRREDRSIPESARVIELDGRIVLPRFVEPHVHLDKCHTISRLDGVGGDAGSATCLVDRLDGARPPIVGGLLRPTRSRGGRRVASAASRDDLALLIEENGLGAAGTNVDADEEAHAVDGTGASSTE